ncbi:SDR family oxidoreductase [Pseudarthrobacter sp. RMG13]|uniref:SDR family oxidoreductase n=1 Tax=Pseudarthrobacter humi TaxID=2952523 RepID=A0ABT1LY10_9MICC|nr:SDR family oxidoreductase [Pseudarthrobacter humi]MCP9002051.1 SDR family oxidoreductase [Pseudarthrobacter humi]
MTQLNMFSLQGKRALVTGGGRGLGQAIARGLTAAGAHTALISRTRGEVTAAAAEIGANAFPFEADVADTAAIPKLLDDIETRLDGSVDIVVHAAGVQHRQNAEAFPLAEWDRIISVNLTAPFMLSQEIGRRQLERGQHGNHIFIGSLTSHLSVPDVVAYTASKSGVYGVVRSLSSEWSARGIRVNGIGPGYFRTQLTESAFQDASRKQKMLDRIPMNRFGDPEDLVGAAVFLASAASSYITGQMLMVDGGWTAS